MSTTESPWLRVADAATDARVHPQQIYRACRLRQLEHVKVSGRRVVLTKREWIDAWLASQTVHVSAHP
jgi:hypothetical protein